MKIDMEKKYKVGDIIFPYYNGTAVWYKISRWTVVLEVNKAGRLRTIRDFYIHEIAELYSEIVMIKEKIKK